jgi:hypothetical protein
VRPSGGRARLTARTSRASLSILTGISAGVTEGVVIVPFDLVKVRLQDPASVRCVCWALLAHAAPCEAERGDHTVCASGTCTRTRLIALPRSCIPKVRVRRPVSCAHGTDSVAVCAAWLRWAAPGEPRDLGPLAFFNGLESTVWRNGVWNGFYFGSIFRVREMLPPAKVRSAVLGDSYPRTWSVRA